MNEKVDFEEVTIRVPRAIMNWLRNSEEVTGRSPTEQLEYGIVADIEGCIGSEVLTPTPEQIIEKYKLGQVFKTILDC